MPDMEKVIKGLQIERECVSRDCDRVCGKCDLVQDRDWLLSVYDDALALLKEQDAVEARKKNDGKPQPWTSWWYVCGDCGQEIEYHDRFCRWCGRSVKWDG